MALKMILLIVSIFAAAMAATTEAQSLTGCPNKCGDVDIPYPFGVGVQPGTLRTCFLDEAFELTCNKSTLFFKNELPVSNISVEAGEMDISMHVARICYNHSGLALDESTYILNTGGFSISSAQNMFVSIGCDTAGLIYFLDHDIGYSGGCMTLCDMPPPRDQDNTTCSGSGCCQVRIPTGKKNFSSSVMAFNNHSKTMRFNNCSYAFLAKTGWFNFTYDYLGSFPYSMAPLALDWTISGLNCHSASNSTTGAAYACKSNTYCVDSTVGVGYNCMCKTGFEGNPYHPDGCHDIDECSRPNNCSISDRCHNFDGGYSCSCPPHYKGDGYTNGTGCKKEYFWPKYKGLLIIIIILGLSVGLLVVLAFIFWAKKQIRSINLKQRNFDKNGGYMLRQLIQQHGYTERTKIFSEVELQKATNNFDECRIIGQGGQCVVYKGILSNTPIAIKKAKIGGDARNIRDFISEVAVLSQINHKNVVRLLGCCLERDTPLLVYEFVDNGTLFEHIDPSKIDSPLSWDARLKIATEAAEAISYFHSIRIVHRDIKSTNILLDSDYNVKVSDFGASRLVSVDESDVLTLVQGTFGYLDPQYLKSCQLNEKSDVYSFGVVLAELLTGLKVIDYKRKKKEVCLAMYLESSIKKKRLRKILDKRVLDEENEEEMKQVASLARRCFREKSEGRPTMKEIAKKLEGLVANKMGPLMTSDEREDSPDDDDCGGGDESDDTSD